MLSANKNLTVSSKLGFPLEQTTVAELNNTHSETFKKVASEVETLVNLHNNFIIRNT